METPEIVQGALGEEAVAATVALGGSDRLYVTPTRTLVYRAEGLLSDESVDEYPHGAERIELAQGRRKSKLRLDYGLDGERTLALPAKHVDDALHPILAGTLNAAEVTDPGETVKHTFRFSELTLLVTSARIVKHVGTDVWDQEFEEYHYDDVTDLTFEQGSVATSVVLGLGDRQERFKAPNDDARRVREAIEDALFAHHGVSSIEEFRVTVAPPEEGEAAEAAEHPGENVSFGDGPEPLSANPPNVTGDGEPVEEADDGRDGEAGGAGAAAGDDGEGGFADSGFEPAADGAAAESDVAAELADLRAAVEAQNERLARHEELVEQLIAELRQGR